MKKDKSVEFDTTALEAQSQTPLANVAPRGLESGIDNEDLIMPRVRLIQELSPDKSDVIPVGSIINSLTKDILSEKFIPIFFYKNYIKFNPKKRTEAGFDPAFEPGKMIWRTDDPLDPRVEQTKFGANNEKPIATAFLNFFCLFEGATMPIILSFSKTSYKAGKNLLSLCKFSGGDMFSRKYILKSKLEPSEPPYYVLNVQPNGFASVEEATMCEQLWKDFSRKQIVEHDIDPE